MVSNILLLDKLYIVSYYHISLISANYYIKFNVVVFVEMDRRQTFSELGQLFLLRELLFFFIKLNVK